MRLHLIFASALFSCATWLGLFNQAAAGDPSGLFTSRRSPIVELVKRVKPAVVNIHSERTIMSSQENHVDLAPPPNRVNGMGTGIILDQRGYILTNHHVVEDVSMLRVFLSDGTSANARVVARDSESDLALLKIDVGRPLPTIPLGTAQDLMVGETVVAIGNAYGYPNTVTVGIVSALKRDVALNKEISYKGLIQTDALINPGNSGGPLLNIHGELIGVNVAIRAGAQGIGFTIPVDTMLRVAAEMMSVRRRNGVWHGLVLNDEVNELDSSEVETVTVRPESPKRRLVLERTEAGSPAAKAGLQRGDVIQRVNNQNITCALELERALLETRPGDRINLVIRRKDSEQKLELVLASVDRAAPASIEMIWRRMGLRLQPVSGELVSQVNAQLHGGLTVLEVRADGSAARAGIQRGDILVGLHQWEMLSLENVLFVLNHNDLANFYPLRFYIIRAGKVHRGWIQQVD